MTDGGGSSTGGGGVLRVLRPSGPDQVTAAQLTGSYLELCSRESPTLLLMSQHILIKLILKNEPSGNTEVHC